MRKKNNIDDLLITIDGILSTSETVSINFNDKKATYEMGHCFLPNFVLVTLLLLIFVTIFHYFIKHRSKQKDTLSC